MDQLWHIWGIVFLVYFGFWILYSWIVNCWTCPKTRYVLLSFPVTLTIRFGIWALLGLIFGVLEAVVACIIFLLVEIILVFLVGWYGLFGWYEYSIYRQHCYDYYNYKCSNKKGSDDDSSVTSDGSDCDTSKDSGSSGSSSSGSSSSGSSSDASHSDRGSKYDWCVPRDLDRYYKGCRGFWYCRRSCGPTAGDIDLLAHIFFISIGAIAFGAGLFAFFQLPTAGAPYSIHTNTGLWFWFWAFFVAFLVYYATVHITYRVAEPCHRWVLLNYRFWIVVVAIYFFFVGIWSGAPWYYGLLFIILWIVIDHWVICGPYVGYGRQREWVGLEALIWAFLLYAIGVYFVREYTLLPGNPEAVAIRNPSWWQMVQGLVFVTQPNTAMATA
jgi:hypothetical protein